MTPAPYARADSDTVHVKITFDSDTPGARRHAERIASQLVVLNSRCCKE